MFMPRELSKFDRDSEMLETNMANITNELSELIVSKAPVIKEATTSTGNRFIDHRYHSDVEERYSFHLFHQSKVDRTFKPRSQSIDATAKWEFSNPRQFIGGTPYKRRGSAADAEQHEALLCAAMNDDRIPDPLHAFTQSKRTGMRRKFSRSELNEPIDYESVVIDLKAIGLSTENRVVNDVMRLFGVFRKFHYYLNDIVPCVAEPDLTDYPSIFAKPALQMPCTMNVQGQIKHAIHRANTFCYHLFEKLDEFKLATRDKYLECSRSLFVLRKMIKQLEPFKAAEFEHKQGVFVNEFGAAQAKNLEIQLTQIYGKARECNIFVEVYLWSVKNYINAGRTPSMETLKKAVAIAGATLGEYSKENSEEEKEENLEEVAISNKDDLQECNNPVGNNDNGNGGGIAGNAYTPAPYFNARAMRNIGV